MSNKKILIIDNDSGFVTSTMGFLEEKGYKVSSAGNKKDSIDRIGQFIPDLIIMEAMMDKLTDGFDLVRELKNDEKYKKIPIFMLTAVGEKTGFSFSEAGGDKSWLPVDEYAQKPVKSEELIDSIEKLISK